MQATHLSNLVPGDVDKRRPDTSILGAFLERARLPEEIVAFAACLLDALSRRFAGDWRAVCMPLRDCEEFRRNNVLSSGWSTYVSSEVIVLAALAIAHGYLTDSDRETRAWAQVVGHDRYTVREIERTKWSILRDIDYGLVRVSEEMVDNMLRDMHRAAGKTVPANPAASKAHGERKQQKEKDKALGLKLNLDAYHGAAIWIHGVQTPEPSP